MKNNVGITLISLVVTVIVMMIISSIIIVQSQISVQVGNLNKMYNDIRLIEEKINVFYSKYGELPVIDVYNGTEKGFRSEANPNDDPIGYYIIDLKALENMSLSYGNEAMGELDIYIINKVTHTVYYVLGVEAQGITYYSLPNDYAEVTIGATILNPAYTLTPAAPTKARMVTITVEETSNSSGVLEIEGPDGNIVHDSTMTWYATSNGTYTFILRDKFFNEYPLNVYVDNVDTTSMIIVADGSWNGTINTPNLTRDMIAVYWDESNNEIDQNNSAFDGTKWYDYGANTGASGVDDATNRKARWANAKTEDGSYWVWIPRYEYKIIPLVGTDYTKAGTIDVNFIETIKTAPTSGYTIHPAFASNVNNGGWGSEVAGIWVAKYEMSMEENGVAKTPTVARGATGADINGSVATSSTIKMVSKPGVSSWRFINIANCYENSFNYDRSKESHLMKNSEWGAVAYLTHSKYGRNGVEVTINNNGDTNYTGGNSGEGYKTNTTQSSTGNVTGIYDLSGNAYEYVAAFNSVYSGTYYTGETYINAVGTHFASSGGASTKYATAYSNSTSTSSEDFIVGDVSHIGDGIHEVWVDAQYGWFSDHSYFTTYNNPFFRRGGSLNSGANAGVFYSYYYSRWCLRSIQFSCGASAIVFEEAEEM